MSTSSKPVDVTVVDTNTASWELLPVDHIHANLEHVPLLNDEETGVKMVSGRLHQSLAQPTAWCL